jgi:hypothetical protein
VIGITVIGRVQRAVSQRDCDAHHSEFFAAFAARESRAQIVRR